MTEKYILLKNISSRTQIIRLGDNDGWNQTVCPNNSIYTNIILYICENDKEFCKYHGQDIIININGKLCYDTESIINACKPGINTLQWFTRQRGGIFMEIINFFTGLLKLVLFIPKLIMWVAALILWMIKACFFIFIYATKVLSADGIFGLIKFIAFDILLAPFNVIINLAKIFFNWIGRNTIQAVWGADNVPEPGEPSDRIIPIDKCDPGNKCYKTAAGTIPFSVIIATILCPPVGVFMEYGLSGWINILICALLTLVFYFPGLIYALILLYC